jgi:hypothetical protein
VSDPSSVRRAVFLWSQMRYEPRTAITFLLAGLGFGALVVLILAPRPQIFPAISDRRTHERRQGPHLSRAV